MTPVWGYTILITLKRSVVAGMNRRKLLGLRFCAFITHSKLPSYRVSRFNDLLDAPKTGEVLRGDVRKADEEQSRKFEQELKQLASSDSKEPFIFNVLEAFGMKLLERNMDKFKATIPTVHHSEILLQPYQDARKLCETRLTTHAATSVAATSKEISSDVVGKSIQIARRSDLHLIEKHVNKVYGGFCKKLGDRAEQMSFKEETEKKNKKKSRSDIMLPISMEYSREIPGLTGALPNVEHIKASYAYSKGKGIFGKGVAFRTLCQIMVNASDEGGAPCSRLLDQVKSISGGARRLF